MILLVATLLVAAGGYAESSDSLKVENVMSIDNPNKVTITESDNRLTVEIDGKKDNPGFRYVREVEISPSDVSVTKERNSDWDFNIPFRKHTEEQKRKRNAFVVKDFKIGLSTVQGAPDNMDVTMGSSWEITTPSFGWEYYPWKTRTSLSIGVACSWRNYQLPYDRQTALYKGLRNGYVYRCLSRRGRYSVLTYQGFQLGCSGNVYSRNEK